MNILLVAVFTLFLFALVLGVFFLSRTRTKSTGKPRNSRALHKAQAELKRNPNSRSAMVMIANLYYQQEDWIDAHYAYRQLYGDRFAEVSPLPQEFERCLHYAIAAYKSKDVDHAHRLLAQLKQIGQQSFEYHKYIGLCAYHKHEFSPALSAFKSAYRLKASDIEVRKYIAFTDYQLGNANEARTKLEVLNGIEHDPDVQYILGSIYVHKGEYVQATRIFSKLAKIDSHTASALIMLGDIAEKQHDLSKSLEYYTRASKITNLTGAEIEVGVLYRMSMLLMEMGKSPAALKRFREVDRLQPDYKDARAHIAKLNFSLEHKALGRYLSASQKGFSEIVSTLIPRILRVSPSEVTPLNDVRSSWYDYSVTIPSADKRRSETVLCRFARTQSDSGEVLLRDLYDKMHAGRFARGVFVTAGQFTVTARRFASTRTIALCDSDQLQSLLKKSAG